MAATPTPMVRYRTAGAYIPAAAAAAAAPAPEMMDYTSLYNGVSNTKLKGWAYRQFSLQIGSHLTAQAQGTTSYSFFKDTRKTQIL